MAVPSSFSKSARKSPRKRAMLRSAVGPAGDLASHVKSGCWRDTFNASWLRTDGDRVRMAAHARMSYADTLVACAERQALATRRAQRVRAA